MRLSPAPRPGLFLPLAFDSTPPLKTTKPAKNPLLLVQRENLSIAPVSSFVRRHEMRSGGLAPPSTAKTKFLTAPRFSLHAMSSSLRPPRPEWATSAAPAPAGFSFAGKSQGPNVGRLHRPKSPRLHGGDVTGPLRFCDFPALLTFF